MPAAARFVMSAPNAAGLPHLGLPEVAFIGRSNVGKSSLIGALLQRKHMVRTSRTPGRTRLLNLFVFDERIACVDLPGYGYAKMSKSDHAQLERLIDDYLRVRESASGLVLLVDARRDPVSELDKSIANWVRESGHLLLVAVTKSDLVPKNRLLGRVRAIETQLDVPAGSAVAVSAKSGYGRKELVARLLELRG